MTIDYYVSAHFIAVPCTIEQMDPLSDRLMEGLLEVEKQQRGIYDAGIGVAGRDLDVDLMVCAGSPEEAVDRYMACVRAQLLTAGISPAGVAGMEPQITLEPRPEAALAAA